MNSPIAIIPRGIYLSQGGSLQSLTLQLTEQFLEGDAFRIKYVRDQKEKETFDRLRAAQNDTLVLCSTLRKTCPLSMML
ncbi:hypothetical protein CEXT_275501 [Caerostris extrusa]|uniref:Uncharacterized protein n=1 Tax=Caerostris extrusa TaxID=172846 RepID=A0AAV4Y7L2_CAEEX|nr:hypothetical protein CEXT_275501 [Caerostris extrusa]